MLEISFSPTDQALAERIQSDLARSGLRLEHSYRLILLTPAGLADAALMADVTPKRQEQLVPVVLGNVSVPPALAQFPVLSLPRGYKRNSVIFHLRRLDLGDTRIRANNRWFVFLGVVALLAFSAALVGIISGMVQFPVQEYAEEATRNTEMILTFTGPTLEAWQPRTTQDALAFPMTVEAANTRNAPLLRMTATQQHQDLQATAQALETAIQATSAALTATPQN